MLIFLVLASLLLLNYISLSVLYKKQDIGILRALGARSKDVVKVFGSEALIITAISFVIALIGAIISLNYVNNFMMNTFGINITLFRTGFRQVSLLLLITLFVGFISSFIPVKRISSKQPIDAINNK